MPETCVVPSADNWFSVKPVTALGARAPTTFVVSDDTADVVSAPTWDDVNAFICAGVSSPRSLAVNEATVAVGSRAICRVGREVISEAMGARYQSISGQERCLRNESCSDIAIQHSPSENAAMTDATNLVMTEPATAKRRNANIQFSGTWFARTGALKVLHASRDFLNPCPAPREKYCLVKL